MDEDVRSTYGTVNEFQVTLKNGENSVTFKIPNAKTNLTSSSTEITELVSMLTTPPETDDDFNLFVVNDNGQNASVEAVSIDLIQTTRTKII